MNCMWSACLVYTQVAVTSTKGNVMRFRVGSKYKKLVVSTRYNKSPYTARTMLRSPLRMTMVKQVHRIIRREMHQLCSTKYGGSFLRGLSAHAITTFSWKPVVAELKMRAPVLYSLLKAAIVRPRQKVSVSAIGIAASVMLRCRSKFLSQAQGVISVLLYAGHCSKQVCVSLVF